MKTQELWMMNFILSKKQRVTKSRTPNAYIDELKLLLNLVARREKEDFIGQEMQRETNTLDPVPR